MHVVLPMIELMSELARHFYPLMFTSLLHKRSMSLCCRAGVLHVQQQLIKYLYCVETVIQTEVIRFVITLIAHVIVNGDCMCVCALFKQWLQPQRLPD